MKLMNRFLAFSLGLLLTLHSICLPAYANELDEQEDLTAVFEDILVDPTDYVLEAGIAPTSLGLTLSAAQIAALIAGSVGVVFTASNWDALASHMQTALNNAASNISGGTEALLNWWSAAVNGEIKLSALTLAGDIWIAKTILDTCYNIHQGINYPAGDYGFGGYATPVSGRVIPAGTPFYVAGVDINSNGMPYKSASRCYKFDFDCVVFRFCHYNDLSSKYTAIDEAGYVFKLSSGSSGQLTLGSNTTSWNADGSYTSQATGSTHFYKRIGISSQVYDNVVLHDAYVQLVLPGAFEVAEPFSQLTAAKSLFDQYLSGDVIDGYGSIPVGESVCPDVMVGGISQAWSDQGIGTDVITLPDISIDGSTLISGDSSSAIDQSISDALGKVATGELTWDDLWLDISGAKPEILVKDDAAEDVGPELGLPDWFVDFCDRVTGNLADRNDKIDSLLPGLGDGMASIDDFESDILDQFNNAFNDLDLDGFQLSSGILAALTWLVYWLVQFFNASGDLQVVILLPMFLGLALLFIGRGSMAMQRVEASHLKASLKKDGGGSS